LTEPEEEPSNLAETVESEPEAGGLAETVVRGAGLAGAGYILGQVLTLGFYVALAHLATPRQFGQFAEGTLVVNISMVFTESGMMAALIHRKDRIDEAASTAVVASACGGMALTLAALALAPLIGLIFDSSTVTALAAASAGLLFLRSLLVVPESLLQRRFSFLRRMVIEPAGAVIFGIAAVIATANGLGAWGLLIGFYAAALTDVALSWTLVQWRPRLQQISFSIWRELIAYGRHVLGGAALWRASDQVPVLLIGRFAGASALGQFRFGSRIVGTPLSLIVQGGSYVLFPALARITANRDRFRDACKRSLRLMCAVAFPLALILVPLGVPIAVLVFGGRWEDAGYATMALAAMPVAGTLVSFTSEVVKADGRPDILPRVHATILVTGTIFMAALVPLDLIGIVAGFALGWVAGGIYGLRRTAGLFAVRVGELWREVLPPLIAALVMAAVLTPLQFFIVQADSHGRALGLALVAGQAVLGLVIYLGALSILARPTLRELGEVGGRLMRRGRSRSDEPGAGSVPVAGAPVEEGR
jgi:O-antigen/teichoic acid export membrane protein